jgi:hypothetical protein
MVVFSSCFRRASTRLSKSEVQSPTLATRERVTFTLSFLRKGEFHPFVLFEKIRLILKG